MASKPSTFQKTAFPFLLSPPPSRRLSQTIASVHYCVIYLHGFPNSSFIPERQQPLTCIVVYDTSTTIVIRGPKTPLFKSEGTPPLETEMWANWGTTWPVEQGWIEGSTGSQWPLGQATNCITAFLVLLPGPGTISLQRTTQTPEYASSCQW